MTLLGTGEGREFFIDNLLVRIRFIIVMIWWTGLAPWEFEFRFPGSLTSTFLGTGEHRQPHGIIRGPLLLGIPLHPPHRGHLFSDFEPSLDALSLRSDVISSKKISLFLSILSY